MNSVASGGSQEPTKLELGYRGKRKALLVEDGNEGVA